MVKNYLSILFFIFSISSSKAIIVDEKGEFLPEVYKIFSYFQTHHLSDEVNVDNAKNISILNSFAQKKFLRPKGSERFDKKSIAHYKELCSGLSLIQKEEIINNFKELKDIEAIYPKIIGPDYIAIQGSTIPDMRDKIMFLSQLIRDQKINIKPNTQIVFLVGERGLYSSETSDIILDTRPYEKDPHWQNPEKLPTDEREAAKLVWAQLKLPEILRQKKPNFVEAEKAEGNSRAQTQDCAKIWLTQEEVKGNVMMISTNPFIGYQENILKIAIKKAGLTDKIYLEGVGAAAPVGKFDIDTAIGILLDNLARIIYSENQFRELLLH